ncbi:MAG: dienelactone hydrolase [Gemmatimonadetes bacterium]|nr:dienelactone hydrolase [Gemmatimonadota bacterium]
MMRTVDVRTADGTCPVEVFSLGGGGQWPGVIVFMDIFGVRPAMREIAQRVCDAGYVVLLPDLYYRSGATPPVPAEFFSDRALQAEWSKTVGPTLSAATVMRDVPALLGLLDSLPEVQGTKVGITGYCRGGQLSLVAAGTFPDRVAAAASYHGAGLVTDAPDSPHRLAPNMKARVYVGGAIEDGGFTDAHKAALEKALTDAGVDHLIETYQAHHGWVPSDTPAHDPAAAERHFGTLLALLAALPKAKS